MSKKEYAFKSAKRPSNNAKKVIERFNSQIFELYQQNKTQEALMLSQQALKQFPNDPMLLSNAGAFALLLNNLIIAEKYLKKTISIDPNNIRAHNNLANLFQQQKHFVKAQTHFKNALKISPNFIDSHYGLANLYLEGKDLNKAKEQYQKTLKLDPNHINAYKNLAEVYKKQKHLNEAQGCYQTILKIDPNDVNAQSNLSVILLSLGRLQLGWQTYESRYHTDIKNQQSFFPNIDIKQYNGEDLNGKNLLIYPEQGFGDEIQFIRYLPLLKSQKGVKEIMLICKPGLEALFNSMECIDYLFNVETFQKIDNLQGIDHWMFIMSLPLHFNTTLETIPNSLPYLSSPQEKQDKWKDKLPQGVNIGLVWKGRKIHKNDEIRSLSSIKTLKPLWDLKEKLKDKVNLNFISLQKSEGEEEAQNPPTDQPLIHLGTDIQDFSDTAAIVSQLDLVICVDTAIAHLAGSLNTPCWVLLPYYGTDWRWMEDRDDSLWYPDITTLFRQSQEGDWSEVVQNVTNTLENLMHTKI